MGEREKTFKQLFPHGRCQCDGPTCCQGRGPAAYRVEREGRTMRVCTKCDLSSDANKTLLVTEKDKADVWMEFDALGAFRIMHELQEARTP